MKLACFLIFNAAAFLKHPRTPTNAPGMDYQTADSEHLMKRMRTGPSDEVPKIIGFFFLFFFVVGAMRKIIILLYICASLD